MPKDKKKDDLDTPVMRQYLEVKSRFPDAILFFRMGDFYEMFLDDAKEAAGILDIALTKRQNSIPMAGIPYHSTESYVSRLLNAGKKIVICEQVKSDDPKAKIMNREVVRIISPGTVIEENLLAGYKNNFLGIVVLSERMTYLGFADVSTGDLLYFSYPMEDPDGFRACLCKFSPKEIVLPPGQKERWDKNFPEGSLPFTPLVTVLQEWGMDEDSSSTESYERYNEKVLEDNESAIEPDKTGDYAVLEHILDCYLKYNYRENSFAFKTPEIWKEEDYLVLDEESVMNLELIENDRNRDHTLFGVLNYCRSSVGKRTLRKNILFPSRSGDTIQKRWEGIEILSDKKLQSKVREELDRITDLERILSRFRGNKAYPRDFSGILRTLDAGKSLVGHLSETEPGKELESILGSVEKIAEGIRERLFDGELPAIFGNGPFLKEGFDTELDTAREAKEKGKDWILALEEKEKKESGLSTLKIRYNKILGYYIEISRSQAKSIPDTYLKKQTLVTSERFTCPELEEIERNILEADEIIERIEKREFDFLVGEIIREEKNLQILSRNLGNLDFLLAITIAKDQFGWKKPEFSNSSELYIKDSRHPVVEKFLPIGETFVPNGLHLDHRDESIALLTGPNMAGKSTFMRQIALNQILFQIGSYLPAKEAKLPLVDRIFTRIGSGDNLTAGESTFYVEMKETAHILNHMTKDSLILFDEVGRGTSTYDGLSLAWAILEFLSERDIRTKTIFATHYHELTDLERGNGIFNLYMDTYEKEGEVLFLKKVKRGNVKKSFGIYVAKIAGIPTKITRRAEEILEGLESKKKEIRIRQEEPSLFPGFQSGPDRASLALERIRKRLSTLQVDKTTPIEALQILDELQRWSKEK